jgi:hypothetical protein
LALAFIAFNLRICGEAQANHAHGLIVEDGIHGRVEPVILRRDADPAIFAIILGVIDLDQHGVPVELIPYPKRDAVFFTVRLVFLRVELDFHHNYCTYDKCSSQTGCTAVPERHVRGRSEGDFKIQTCLNLNRMVGIAAGMTVDSMQDAALEENNEDGAMA